MNDYQAYLVACGRAMIACPDINGRYPLPSPPRYATPPRRIRVRLRSPRLVRLRAMRSRDVGPALTWRGQRTP